MKLPNDMENINITKAKERPIFITVLCTIAFVHLGLAILIGVFSTIAVGIPDAFKAIPYLSDLQGIAGAVGGLIFSIVTLVLAIIGFMGVIQIWNLLKAGFWTYSITMILFLVVPFLIIDLPFRWVFYMTLPNLLIIPVLITLFGFNYKNL